MLRSRGYSVTDHRSDNLVVIKRNGKEDYKACGIERYRFLETLDLRTSKKCRELDGKIFLVSEAKVGVNHHPMHPFCRSTTTSVVDEELLKKWTRSTRDPVTGKTMKVPATMTYNEWYQTYVKGNKDAETEEKKIRNRESDRKQHEAYRKVLGKEILEKLDDFQNMKYNESEKWNALKLSFRKTTNANTPLNRMEEPMQLKHVHKVLSDMKIDYGDAKIKIVRDPEMIESGYFGWTSPNMKEVQLYPDAFTSREELVKTLGHERIHIEQLRMWGPADTDGAAIYYEKGPRFSEEYWWREYRRLTGYDGEKSD